MASMWLELLATEYEQWSEEQKQDAANLVRYVEEILRHLMDYAKVPNVRLNRVAINMWRVCESKAVRTAAHASEHPEHGIHTVFAWQPGQGVPVLLFPRTWSKQFAENPVLQTAAMVFLGSQCNDYALGHFINADGTATATLRRSFALEADFYRVVRAQGTPFEPNDYQQKVLRNYPEGWDSLPESLRYEHTPVSPNGWDIPGPSLREMGLNPYNMPPRIDAEKQ